jgi:P-type Ca2+ transporter type 2C
VTKLAAAPDDPPSDGLSEAEAKQRLVRDGYNEITTVKRGARLRRQLEILREPMFGLLVGAGILYALIGEPVDAAVLGAFATVSVSIAMIQRGRSDRVLAALRELSSPQAFVIREGVRRRIPGREVVAGDMLVVNEGDRMPADAVLVAGEDVLADESLLTGESVPVRKRAVALSAVVPARPGGEDLPQLYSGSLIVRGSGVAVTTATGARAEVGKIDTVLQGIKPVRAGLEAQTRRWVLGFALLGLSVSALAVLILGLMRGDWLEALLAGVALAMSLLPEELPLVLTVFTVMGAWRLARSRVLTRRPAAIETLGAATVLCTDKTGTLTCNRMSVACLMSGGVEWDTAGPVPPPDSKLRSLLHSALMATRPEALDPMDQAVVALASQFELNLTNGRQLIRTFPLRSCRPFIVQAWLEESGGIALAAKGAPEAIARLSRLDADRLASVLADAHLLASKGVRVLAVARGELLPGAAVPDEVDALPLQWQGLVGFVDPLRPSVPAAISSCHEAGVRVIMITGDHPATAAAIAAQAGMPGTATLTGTDIDALDDAALAEAVRTVDIFARIRPEQKLRLVEALKSQGHVVGMTGDGINDAPALKAAHIGIAMGSRGTDVAREAAVLVLLDDDFSALADAIRLGRRIYDNIGKAVGYILSVHVPIAGIALLPILLGMPLVLNPMLIALLELLIDPACSVIFEAEPAEKNVMRRRPRSPSASLITTRLALRSLLQGGAAFAFVAAIYLWHTTHGASEELTRSNTLLMLLLANFCLVLSHRNLVPSLRFSRGERNPALVWGMTIATLFLVGVFAWPPARGLLRLAPLDSRDLLTCLAAGVVLWVVLQIAKKGLAQRNDGELS